MGGGWEGGIMSQGYCPRISTNRKSCKQYFHNHLDSKIKQAKFQIFLTFTEDVNHKYLDTPGKCPDTNVGKTVNYKLFVSLFR